MRASTTLASDNLRDGSRRAGYLVLTLAITAAAWLVLSALASPFVGGDQSASEAGITITNGSQMNAPLPLRYAQRIEAVPGARDVRWFTLMMLGCGKNVQVTVQAMGGPGTATEVSSSLKPAGGTLMQRWQTDPIGVLITSQTAADCGWQTGQGVEPSVVFGTKQVPLHISGVFHDTGDAAYAHYDYINRIGSFAGKDNVLQYLANGGSATGDEQVAARIEAAFAHDFPTVSATTNATVQNAWARYGKVQQLLAFVMAAILLCAASVLVSVLAHAAAQRRAKFALLQVLGFRRGTLFGALAIEVLVIVILGALVGVGVGKLVAHAVAPTTIGIMSGGFGIPIWAYAWMPAWLAILVIAALAWPAALVARVRASDYRAI